MEILRKTEEQILKVTEEAGYMHEKRMWSIEAVKEGYAYYNKRYIMIVREEHIYLYPFSRCLTDKELKKIDQNVTKGFSKVKELLIKGQKLNLKETGFYYARELMCIVRDEKVIVYTFEKPELQNYDEVMELLKDLEA